VGQEWQGEVVNRGEEEAGGGHIEEDELIESADRNMGGDGGSGLCVRGKAKTVAVPVKVIGRGLTSWDRNTEYFPMFPCLDL